jgi:hypothetical protein
MDEPVGVDLSNLVGRQAPRVTEELERSAIEVRLVPDAIGGALLALVGPASASRAPRGSHVVAYTTQGRVTRFVLDEAATARAAQLRQQASIDALEARVTALEARLASLAERRRPSPSKRPPGAAE